VFVLSVAIGEAARSIRHGYADLMIAGGTETLLTYSAVNDGTARGCWRISR
jgi:3-oxoacyl-(acyl-carrier-protein) synthase